MSWFLSSELQQLGFTPFFMQQLSALTGDGGALPPEQLVARVACERRGEYEVASVRGELRATLSGRLEHELGDAERPAVGDWVVVEPADPVGRIRHLFERQSVLRRGSVDRTSRGQTLAANVDLCLIVGALTPEDASRHAERRALNPRRLERYLATARASRVPALILVNKADLLPLEVAEARGRELGQALPGARVLLVSAVDGAGLDELRAELVAGSSAAVLGSSGVGKSSLINALLGRAARPVSAERAVDTRGRHTTTERQLLRLPGGALLIDTPGMRELSLWADAAEGDARAPDEIAALAGACRYRDCRHESEPGCAVLAAVAAGALSRERLDHAHKLERELLHHRRRVDARLRSEQQREWKTRSREARSALKRKGRL